MTEADDELSRSEMALVRQAIRQDWPIPPAVKKRLLQRLVNLVDSEPDGPPPTPSPAHDDGDEAEAEPPGPSDRTVIAAARTIASFCSLSLKQQALDLMREKHEGRKTGRPLGDVIAEAKSRAEERIRERDHGKQ